jgi:hypothetical protein
MPPTPPLPGCKQDPIPEKPTPAQHRNTQQNSPYDPHSNPLPAIYHLYPALSMRTVKVYGIPRLRRRDPHDHLFDQRDRVTQRPPPTVAPCEPEDTSRPNKLRSRASTSSPARWTDRTRPGNGWVARCAYDHRDHLRTTVLWGLRNSTQCPDLHSSCPAWAWIIIGRYCRSYIRCCAVCSV